MGMKEEAAKILQREQQQKAAAEKTADYYRSLLAGGPPMRLVGYAPNIVDEDPKTAYIYSLLSDMPPELQPVFQEFIQACPDRAWESMPTKAERAKVKSHWNYEDLLAEYIPEQQGPRYFKFRLSDGSIHAAQYFLPHPNKDFGKEHILVSSGLWGLLKGGKDAQRRALLQKAEDEILREAQEQIDALHHPSLCGSQEFMVLTYTPPGTYASGYPSLILFRDGMVFEPQKSGIGSTLSLDKDTIYQFLLETLTKIERNNP